MAPVIPLSAGDHDEEIAALIATLHESTQRLELLTHGQVDSVADQDGRNFLLRHAQEHHRQSEAARQAAILNALPANIALIDARGVIVAVNAAWRLFGDSNGSPSPGHEIGIDYIAVCDKSVGSDASIALEVAAGLRAVLAGTVRSFSIEYPCDSPTIKRWFLLTVSPVAEAYLHGGVVMHVDITDSKMAKIALSQSLEEFRSLAESMPQIVWTTRADGWTTYFNQQWMDYTGLSLEDSLGSGWINPFHPDDRQLAWDAWQHATATVDTYSIESRLRRADGVYRWWLVRGVPLKDSNGTIVKWFGTCTDIHDLTESKLEISRVNQGLRASELRVKYLNRVYAVLSGINTLIVRVREPDELFREACRIAVEVGGFHAALVGMLDPGTRKIVPVAEAGNDEELLAAIRQLLSSDHDATNTVAAMALRTKLPFVSNDAQNDPRILLGKKYAKAGVRSVAACPLVVAGESVGVLTLYADELEFFHDEEMALLNELSNDIAFAIDHLEKSRKLGYLAYHDELTGLPNRQLLIDRTSQRMLSAASGGYQLAVLMFDIERFKSINDSLGRPAGDALLKELADWLTREVGDERLLARLGADHFAIVLPEVKADGVVARFLEKAMAALAQLPFRIGDTAYRITIKAGAALFPDDGDNVDALFQHAEAALKKAKASGNRYLFFSKAMSDKVAGKLTLENKLRLAIDNEQFVLHYQPKGNLASGKLSGAEALIRWNDPATGLVAPNLFIPILEETGLIHEVGRWALRKAIADYLRWRNSGFPPVRIAVNVSQLQLRDQGFVDEIRQVIGIDARASEGLELEITESMLMEDLKHAVASLHAFRAMGVPIAIDDFGTGFSSLGYLSKLPIDTLKIDRSFVIDMTTSAHGLALVSTIINLAHSLELKVVAEGVETEEQKRLLQLLRCNEMQGYLFSKPVPRDVFEARFLATG